MKTCPECSREWPDEAQFCGVDATPLLTTGSSEPEEVIVGHYRVLERLGAGGMGAVYVGEHLSLGRRDAIKMLNRSFVDDADALARFHREARNASTILHENVCIVYDFGETPEGLSFLAMELVDGVSLEELLEQEGGSLDPRRAADIVSRVAKGLQAAHDRSIVHRDLKPGNVMIAKKPGGGDAVKVVDFGIAKAVDQLEDQQITRIGLVAGTREYMAPEHLRGEEADPRSDIYALGVVLFRTLTGQYPFTKEHPGPSPRRLSEAARDAAFPPGLQAVIDRSLEHNPKRRFASASEFGAALESAVIAPPARPAVDPGSVHYPAPGAVAPLPGTVADATAGGRPAGTQAVNRTRLVVAGAGIVGVAATAVFFATMGSGGTALSLDPASIEVAAGGTADVRVLGDDGSAVTTGVSWVAADSRVADVRDGTVTGSQTPGETTLAAVVDGDTVGRVPVRVVAGAPDSVAVDLPSRLAVGDAPQASLSAWDRFGNEIDGADVTWQTSDESVVNVDGGGRVRSLTPGSATIIALVSNPPHGSRESRIDITVSRAQGNGSQEQGDGGGDVDTEARMLATLRTLCAESLEREFDLGMGEFDRAWGESAVGQADPLFRQLRDPSLKQAAAQVLSLAYGHLVQPEPSDQWEAEKNQWQAETGLTNACTSLLETGQ